MINNSLNKVINYFIGKHIKILLYHGISDNPMDPCSVSLECFRAQMKYVADKGYNIISLKDALGYLDNGGIPGKTMVLTFDDGFVDFFENALPILNKYNFKSTVFVVASQVGGISDWRAQNLNRRLMNWEQLKEIIGMGHFIGSHSLHHSDLTKLTQKELDEEISVSKNIIQEKLGVKADSFSYPWSKCGNRELDSVRQAGYSCALSVGSRWHNNVRTNRFLLERVSIEQGDSLDKFAKKLR